MIEVSLVRCPNYCIAGEVKIWPEPNKALYVMEKCKFCEGEGVIPESKYDEVNNLINNE